MRGSLFMIAAPSGAGKTSLVNALLSSFPNLYLSISYTTRAKRPNEKNGEDYHFVSRERFKEMIQQGVFLEHAEVFGNFYGTSRVLVEEARNQGLDVILEIDWQGARQVRTQFVEAQGIFILPLSLDVLQERLEKRQPDQKEVVLERMRAAKSEIAHYKEFDYIIFNDQFDVALSDLKAIIQAERLRWHNDHDKDERLAIINNLK